MSALTLFVLGAGLAYYTLPRRSSSCRHRRRQLQRVLAAGKYFKLITYMMLAFGIGFEFPILLIFMQMAGIVGPRRWPGSAATPSSASASSSP